MCRKEGQLRIETGISVLDTAFDVQHGEPRGVCFKSATLSGHN